MPKAQAIQINWQFTGSAGIMQVEHTADCFGGAWLKTPLSTEVWHPRHIWREIAFQFAEELTLNGETYVVSVNELSATCNWQVVGVQVDELRQRLITVWYGLEQSVVDDAIDHWRRRLLTCVDAEGGHFEHNLGP